LMAAGLRQRDGRGASDDVDDAQPPHRRATLEEAQKLGPLYGTLNQAMPLVRLYAIWTFLSKPLLRTVLGPSIGCIVAGLLRVPVFKLSGVILGHAKEPEEGEEGAEHSSSYHQLRAVTSQLLGLLLQCALVCSAVFAGAGTMPPGVLGPSAHVEVPIGLTAALAMCLLWTLAPRVLGVASREQLAMAEGTHDLSSATEDELLHQMRPSLRLASLVTRCTATAVDVACEILLLFVFLPSVVEGVEPAARPISAAATAALSLAYGSQHLRFRGEWLLGVLFAAAQSAICSHFGGSLWSVFVASTTFAVFRHYRRTDEIRRFHAQ